MDEHVVVATRRSLHAVAERLLAGPQHRQHGTIRLHVGSGGGVEQFAGPLRIEGAAVVGEQGRVRLRGTIGDVAAGLGVAAGAPVGVYADHADLGPEEDLAVDPTAAALLLDWFARATRRCAGSRRRRSRCSGPSTSTWASRSMRSTTACRRGTPAPAALRLRGPVDAARGEFWNAPFGAVRTAEQLPDDDAVTGRSSPRCCTAAAHCLPRPSCGRHARPNAAADGIDLVLVRRGGRVHAFEERRPHRGALLADGRVEGANSNT